MNFIFFSIDIIKEYGKIFLALNMNESNKVNFDIYYKEVWFMI
jgi:hypothetical protein